MERKTRFCHMYQEAPKAAPNTIKKKSLAPQTGARSASGGGNNIKGLWTFNHTFYKTLTMTTITLTSIMWSLNIVSFKNQCVIFWSSDTVQHFAGWWGIEVPRWIEISGRQGYWWEWESGWVGGLPALEGRIENNGNSHLE